jgi:tetratricopeptide (TPR) repeat protein
MNTSRLNYLAALRVVVGLCFALIAGAVAGGAVPAASAAPDCAPFELGQKARAEQSVPAAFAHYKRAVADSCKVAESLRAMAELSMGLDRPDKAASYYRDVIGWVVRHGGRETAADRVGLALALVRQGRPQEAANEIQQAERLDPAAWITVYGRARFAMVNGNWSAALDLMERTNAAKATDPLVAGQYNVVMALYYTGISDLPQAESAALRAVSLDPTDPERLALFHRICTERGTLRVGIGALEQAKIDAGTKPPAPLLAELGRMYEAGRRYNDARDMYVAAVAADSSYAPALRDLGDLMQVAKKPAIAVQFYMRYLGQVPNDVDAKMRLAQACTDLGQTEEAAKAMRSAITLAPTRPDVRRAFARAGLRSSDPTTSRAAANVFNTRAGDTIWTVDDWLALAEYHRDAKVLDAARQATARAAAIEPASPRIEFELGLIEITAGNPDAAVTHMQAAVDRNPEGPNYHLNLGVALVTAGRRAEGIAAMRRATVVNGQFTQGRLVLAQTLTAADSTRASDEQYQAILAYDPANASALRGLGWSRLKAADCKDAVRLFTTASESEPKSSENWVGLGSAAVCANDYALAAKAFEKARQIDPESASVKKGLDLLAQARKGSTP